MRTRSAIIYVNGKRFATMQDIDYTIKSNDGQEMSDGGPVNTDGVITTEVTSNNIIPSSGVGISVVEQMLRKEEVTIQLFVNAQIHVLKDARCTQCQFRGEAAGGKQTGSFQWQAGKPEITG